jgi:hypothetical protein
MTKLTAIMDLLSAGGVAEAEDTDATLSANQFNLMTDVFGVIGKTNYYTYSGSLTTPGCTEGITWFLMANPMTLSPAQVLKFTSMLGSEQGGMSRGGDNRLVQPLNGRTVQASFQPPAAAAAASSAVRAGAALATLAAALVALAF